MIVNPSTNNKTSYISIDSYKNYIGQDNNIDMIDHQYEFDDINPDNNFNFNISTNHVKDYINKEHKEAIANCNDMQISNNITFNKGTVQNN